MELSEFDKNFISLVDSIMNPMEMEKYDGLYSYTDIETKNSIEQFKKSELSDALLRDFNPFIRDGYSKSTYHQYDRFNYSIFILNLTKYYYDYCAKDINKWNYLSEKEKLFYFSILRKKHSYEDYLKILAKNSGDLTIKYILFPPNIRYYFEIKETKLLYNITKIDFNKYYGYIVNVLKLLNINPVKFKEDYNSFVNKDDDNMIIHGEYPDYPEREIEIIPSLELAEYIATTKINYKPFVIYGKISALDMVSNTILKTKNEIVFPEGCYCGFIDLKTKQDTYKFFKTSNPITLPFYNCKFDISRYDAWEFYAFEEMIGKNNDVVLPICKVSNDFTVRKNKEI